MPKVKTHRGYKKRLGKTGSGKLTRKHAGECHFLEKRSKSRKRRLGITNVVSTPDLRRIKKTVAYL